MCLVPHYVVFPCCPGSFFPAFSRPAPQQIMPSLEIGAASCLFLHLSLQHSVQPVVVEHLPLVGLSDTCAQNDARTVVSQTCSQVTCPGAFHECTGGRPGSSFG